MKKSCRTIAGLVAALIAVASLLAGCSNPPASSHEELVSDFAPEAAAPAEVGNFHTPQIGQTCARNTPGQDQINCWDVRAAGTKPVAFAVKAWGYDNGSRNPDAVPSVEYYIANTDGLKAGPVDVPFGQMASISLRQGDQLYIWDPNNIASFLTVVAVQGDDTPFPSSRLPQASQTCTATADDVDCWYIRASDHWDAPVQFALSAHSSDGGPIQYNIHNGVDNLTSGGTINNGQTRSLYMRTGDVLTLTHHDGQQVDVLVEAANQTKLSKK